jgi:hypothetical protein
MNTTLSRALGIRACLLFHLTARGPITSLERWAHDNDWTPWRVRRHAHTLQKQGYISLAPVRGPGSPYRVTPSPELICLEEDVT